jgi:2-C-methyl-D-erythritol 4-phosphate cytidylyltransferase/2-C-methyl-D-erythritol 2,4-cyclodiphosphate synthase
MPKVSAVIVAGGASARMEGRDKIFLSLGGVTVLERSIAAFEGSALIDEIVVVASQDSLSRAEDIRGRYGKVTAVVPGGASRSASVRAGVAACGADARFLAIHDAARPFVSDSLITRVVTAAMEYGAAAPGLPLTDTVKEMEGGFAVRTPDRSALAAVSTPQVFEAGLYRQAAAEGEEAFDDCQLVERIGRKAVIVEGDPANIKITTPRDIERAAFILGDFGLRVGHGYDVHRLVAGRRLVLGGVEIEHPAGLLGHSDADVLVHAVIDALLGAAAMGDIGLLFPDSDERYRGISSIKLLSETAERLAGAGYAVGNIDVTAVCERPKLRPYIEAMRRNMAAALGIGAGGVSVKATTEEGLGFTGGGEGIAAHAVASLIYRDKAGQRGNI